MLVWLAGTLFGSSLALFSRLASCSWRLTGGDCCGRVGCIVLGSSALLLLLLALALYHFRYGEGGLEHAKNDNSNRPELSAVGKAKAKAFGRSLLAKDRRFQRSNNGPPSTTGIDAPQIDIGQTLSLAYKENDVIYFVGVSCAKSGEPCSSNDDCCSDKCNMKDMVCEASS